MKTESNKNKIKSKTINIKNFAKFFKNVNMPKIEYKYLFEDFNI